MYGGIALCVYMSGITSVLFDMVIGTARDQASDDFLQTYEELTDTQRVLRKAAQLRTAFRLKEVSDTKEITDKDSVDCRFVIDILSGTSAGGLNNVFLAKALANEETLDALANLWVNEGDIGELLNDEQSSDPLRFITPEKPPQSLLNSVRMQQRLLDAYQDMESLRLPNGNSVQTSRLVDHLDLYITATDLKGLELGLTVITGTPATERKNRAVFHLAYDPLAVPTVDGSDVTFRNDFRLVHIPFLSFISRATSCIVPAFEPIKLNDLGRLYYRNQQIKYDTKLDAQKFAHFFPDYEPHQYQDRFFGDGGYGDNYPFGPAIDEIQNRRAQVAVDRILLYVEPDPDIRDDAPKTSQDGNLAPRPTFLEHILAALSVKTTEKIRDDVSKVRERSELLERIKYGLRAVSNKPGTDDHATNSPYLKLRETVAVDALADLLWDAANSAKVNVERRSVHWLMSGLHDVIVAGQDGFLKSFDVPTLQRRVKFAGDKVDRQLLDSTKTAQEIETLLELRRRLAGISLRFARISRLVKLLTMGKGDQDFVRSLDAIVSKVGPIQTQSTKPDPKNPIDQIVRSIVDLIPTLDLPTLEMEIKSVMFGNAKRGLTLPHAEALLKNPTFVSLQTASAQLIADVEGELSQFALDFKPFLPHASQGIWADFYAYDQEALPLLYGIEGVESDWITMCRVSPLDSRTLISNPTDAKNKLAGAGLGHFGGFFKDMWRVHDVLWGRLDSVENILRTVVRQDNLARRELIFQGQLAVIKDFKIPLKGSYDDIAPHSTIDTLRASLLGMAVRNFLRDIHEMPSDSSLNKGPYQKFISQPLTSSQIVDCTNFALSRIGLDSWNSTELDNLAKCDLQYQKAEIPPLTQIELTGRSLNVLEGMLETIKAQGKANKAISVGGTVLVTIAKILTPGSLQGSIYRHWLGLAVFFDAVLLACGVVWNNAFALGVRASIFTALAAFVVHSIGIAVDPQKGGIAKLKSVLVAYAVMALTLWLLYSAAVSKWFHLLIETKGEGFVDKWWNFISSNYGLQWVLLSACIAVAYIIWSKIANQSMENEGDGWSKFLGAFGIFAIFLFIPAALLAPTPFPKWGWVGFGLYPILVVVAMFLSPKPKNQ